jgi:hypothetical protein
VLNLLIIGSFSPDDAAAHKDVLGNILPVPQVAAVTALVAGVMTILMGLVANDPFAIATGLGINSLVAVTIAPHDLAGGDGPGRHRGPDHRAAGIHRLPDGRVPRGATGA